MNADLTVLLIMGGSPYIGLLQPIFLPLGYIKSIIVFFLNCTSRPQLFHVHCFVDLDLS